MAGGYVSYGAEGERFHLSPEQAMALADESSPVYLPGLFPVVRAAVADAPKVSKAFREGGGVGWHEHHHLFGGTERFRSAGVEDRLRAGVTVADVGCGHGVSTIIMAQAYPASRFVGFDYHDRSIEWARRRAQEAGLGDRVSFEVAAAADYPGDGYGLVTVFDCLHDMGDPVAAAAHVRRSLASDGTFMVVEPAAGDRLTDNLNPVGRLYYSASTLICTPASLAQETGVALGAQAGEARLREVLQAGGFSRVRRAAETPFNLVLEAQP